MKAVVCPNYGPPEVLRLVEAENPIPTDDQVLVKVRASSVNFNTLGFVRGEPFLARLWSGLFKPKLRPGNDIAGQVEAVGKNVKEFRRGDEVFGDLSQCGLGAFAEYIAVSEAELVALLGPLLSLTGGQKLTNLYMTVFVFGIGALIFYSLLYQSNLIPRWLSVWGFIAIVLHLTTGMLIVFGLQNEFSALNSIMNLPIFLQEMAMAVWLIAKGFTPSAVVSPFAKQ